MRFRGRTLALVLVGAVVLASGGYALGSQAGGGSANAKDDPAPATGPMGGGPPGLTGLADRLGVTEQQLGDALKSLRDEQPAPDGDPLGKELADALGVSQADLQAALKKLRPELGIRRGGPLCAPPGDGDVKGARRAHRSGGPGPGGPGFGGPGPGPGPGGPGIGPGTAGIFLGPGSAAALAKELGIDQSKVEDALKTVRDKHEADAKERREAFAQKLADKLGISVDKVKAALPEPPFGGRHP